MFLLFLVLMLPLSMQVLFVVVKTGLLLVVVLFLC